MLGRPPPGSSTESTSYAALWFAVQLNSNCSTDQPTTQLRRYLKGANNELALKHIPEVAPRTDTNGGQPLHRRADYVGGIFIVHKDDMLQYMHDWVKITEAVRFDPDVRFYAQSHAFCQQTCNTHCCHVWIIGLQRMRNCCEVPACAR